MKTNVGELPAHEAVQSERVSPRWALPPEVAATLLAVSTVLLGALLALPTYGIFLGWAAAGLAASGRAVRMLSLGSCLAIGTLFGAGTLAAQSALGQILGPVVPPWACLVVVLAVANPLMIMLGRVSAFSSVPGMFIGFSTLLAVHLGSPVPISDSIFGALIVSASMNLGGLGFYWLYNHMTRRSRVDRQPHHAGTGLAPKLES